MQNILNNLNQIILISRRIIIKNRLVNYFYGRLKFKFDVVYWNYI